MSSLKTKVKITDAQIDAALTQASQMESSERRAVAVAFNRKLDLVSIELADGIRVSIPRTMLQGLQDASPEQVAKIEILGRGTGLHWPELDVDHHVPGLLNHVFGTSRWMAELGRRGGASTSRSKALAARANGKKGGRPKKRVA